MECIGKNIIILCNVRDESVFFYKFLNQDSIIILLNKPQLKIYNDIFNEFCNKIGCTVYIVGETFSQNEENISERSKRVIDRILEYYYDENTKVITHPIYTKKSDPQCRSLYDYLKTKNLNNHYAYTLSYKENSVENFQKSMLMRYSMIFKNDKEKEDQFNKYLNLAKKVGNLKLLEKFNYY